jgi:hypothetical protein
MTCCAPCFTKHRNIKGQSARGAARPVNESDRAPAAGAKASSLAHLFAALDTQRRKQKIEDPPSGLEPGLHPQSRFARLAQCRDRHSFSIALP